MMRKICIAMTSTALLLLAGCVSMPDPSTNIHQPMTARPQPLALSTSANGAIYQAGYGQLALFEDRRARNVGDTLTIVIEEKTTASKKTDSKTTRTGADKFGVSTLAGLPGKSFLGAGLNGSSSNSFEGKGESGSNNVFTGNVTVTVVEVLANGNLLVSGEKQVSINQGSEYVRFSGVVNPTTIVAGNTVSSTKVADARIEYKGNGYLDETQTMGWLARLFLSVLPF
jgi:flagellar L-ring protein precursor FlgH